MVGDGGVMFGAPVKLKDSIGEVAVSEYVNFGIKLTGWGVI